MTKTSIYLAKGNVERTSNINLQELVGSLSFALDMTEGQPEGHSIRCCWIGTQIGKAVGLTDVELNDLYFTLLMKDLGCSSNAARICELYMADDISFKRDFKTIDGSLSAALRFVFAKTGLEAGLSDRIRAIVNIIQNGGEIAKSLIETRCHRGAEIAAKMRFSLAVQDGIRSLDEHWDGSGKPEALIGKKIPINSNIALLAQVIDIFNTEQGKVGALNEVQKRSGTWFSPQLVQAFETVQNNSVFWSYLNSETLDQIVFDMTPGQLSVAVDENYLDDIASAFSDVVDAKSSFTADHSNRVTLYSDMIAEEMGLSADHRRWLRRAALLHDIGKLAVSNQILDKPDKLNGEEWKAIRSHPQQSERILKRISAFMDIAPIAGSHHERLDGNGYPNGLKGNEISLETRILTTADVFDALTAERPYRAAMPVSKALSILESDIDSAFDADCVAALQRGLLRLNAAVAA